MTCDMLNDAKAKLRIPELWALLHLPGTPAKSCHVPWREDKNPSGSVYADGLRFHDHATDEDFDAPAFLARVRNLSNADGCREFITLSGVTATLAPAADGPRRIVATYDYQDEVGALLFQVVRFEPKTFRQRRPDPHAPDGWSWKLDGARRVLYRLPEIIAAVQREETIILSEGEKDVAALVSNGFAATCNPGGAGKWLDDYTATLHGADVVIVADKDDAGRNHARLVVGKVHGKAKSIRIVELPDYNGQPVKDAADFFAAGATADDFRAAIAAAQPVAVSTVPDLHAAPPRKVSKPAIELPEESDEPESAPFPLDALPPAMATIIAAVSRTERVPLALPAVCALGVVSAAIGAGLEVGSGPNRVTRGNLYLLASAESGSGKSETFRIIAAPLLDHQTRLIETWRLKIWPQLQSEIRVLDKEIAALERKAAKSGDPSERERLRGELEFKLASKDQLVARAAMPCIIAQDVTTERLAVLLRENREVVFSASADARKLVDNLMGRYNPGKTTDESLYLSAYSGDFVRVDRQGRDAVVLNKPCLALCWFFQPDLMATMLGEQSLSVSGFLPRPLICHTDAVPRRIEGEPQILSESVRGQWTQLIADLLATFHAADKPTRINPSPDAVKILNDFHNHIVDRRSVDLADVGAFAARYAENAWRLSVVLHASLHGAQAHAHPLDPETAANAVRVIEWFAASQLNILAKGRHTAAAKVEEEVLELLKNNVQRKAQDFTSAREVHRARITPTPDAAHALLARMEHDGVLTGEDITPPRGGRTTRIYRCIQNPVPE